MGQYMHMYFVDNVMVTKSKGGIIFQHISRVEKQSDTLHDVTELFINVQFCHQTMDVSCPNQ